MMTHCDSIQDDDDDLLGNQSCLPDFYKPIAWNSLMWLHVSILHDFKEEIIISFDNDSLRVKKVPMMMVF